MDVGHVIIGMYFFYSMAKNVNVDEIDTTEEKKARVKQTRKQTYL